MTTQFVIPRHVCPEVEPFSKEYFQKYHRHLKNEAIAVGKTQPLFKGISTDLFSNLVSEKDRNFFQKGRKIALTKKFTFACSHALPFHEGKCKNLHGHEWTLEVHMVGAINSKGMLLDFSDLKSAVKEHLVEKLDHSYLNALVFNPTAENLCYYIWNVLQYEASLKGIHAIQVWETDTSCATLTAEYMDNYVKGMWEWDTECKPHAYPEGEEFTNECW